MGKLILAVRSHEKGLATKERILSAAATTTATGRDVDPSRIMFLAVDLSSFASVINFCKELVAQVGDTGLDAALLCAGVAPPSYKAVEAGNEEGTWDVAVQHPLDDVNGRNAFAPITKTQGGSPNELPAFDVCEQYRE